ncbi:methionine--tRNA ligase [Kutzneria chonburiensis]|uniref:methionine--tRNA ligase n=1 Tax=Kutzneria chonburiensis TaxID=1483604 RepID=A0ABV6MQM7_9PSEU|nr:methionine--tRNA ligase [Kutzneria chonburiensis]
MATFLSTTIPYVNARPHLGHALEFVQADALARHLSRADDVFFSSGTDENSLKNVQSAQRLGEPTAVVVARHAATFAVLTEQLDVTVDRFVRTSVDQDHMTGAAALWRRMAERGDIYSRYYEGVYCVGCEEFRVPADLVNGKCPAHQREPVVVKERNYFFRLSRYQETLATALASGQIRVRPESRRNEMLGLVRGGLTDISISRSTSRAHGWGIPVPGDDSQIMYVWFDALTNYVNALGWVRDDADYGRFWRDAARRIHVLGKDVARFHAVYWPAMLMSAGLPLPTDLVVHGHITLSGQKLSKSLGIVVDPLELVHRYGTEAVRYLMLAEFSPWADAEFTDQRLVTRYNTDLCNGLGNLVDRVTAMVGCYRGGIVPTAGARGPLEISLLATAKSQAASYDEAFDRFDHQEAVRQLTQLVHAANAYVNERAPWAVTDHDVLDTALHTLVEVLRMAARLLGPILPGASSRMAAALGTGDNAKIVVKPHLFPRLELTW